MEIQQRRRARGWTQEDLARHSDLSTRTIQRIESGQSVGLESLKCIAAVFEVSIHSLMQEKSMNIPQSTGRAKLTKKEEEAVLWAKSIFKSPEKGQKDPLMKIERKAIDKAKALYKVFAK